jgi:hypothetical protein
MRGVARRVGADARSAPRQIIEVNMVLSDKWRTRKRHNSGGRGANCWDGIQMLQRDANDEFSLQTAGVVVLVKRTVASVDGHKSKNQNGDVDASDVESLKTTLFYSPDTTVLVELYFGTSVQICM